MSVTEKGNFQQTVYQDMCLIIQPVGVATEGDTMKKKASPKYLIDYFYEPLWKCNVWYVDCPKHEIFQEVIHAELGVEIPNRGDVGGYSCVISDKKGTIYAFWAPKKTPWFVAHEALHATFNILWDRGLDVSRTSDEAFTYLLEFILHNIYEKKTLTKG